jgi:hypothetical protein
VFINLEGLTLDTLEEAEEFAAFVGLRQHDLGRRVNLSSTTTTSSWGGP